MRRGAAKRVVQHVAAGAGDDQHAIIGAEVEGLAVNRRIFPAGVVDERSGVDRIEQFLVKSLSARVCVRFTGAPRPASQAGYGLKRRAA